MTRHAKDSLKLDKSGLPNNRKIRRAVAEIASTFDFRETSFNEVQRLIAEKLGIATEDLASKEHFIKKCLKEEKEKSIGSFDNGISSVPTKNKSSKAAKKPTSKDLELENDLYSEDLNPTRSIILKVYEDDRELDAKIIKVAKKLARSSKVDLETISIHKFFDMLQEMVGDFDLSLKKDLVYKTLKECKRKHHAKSHDSTRVPDNSTSETADSTKFNTNGIVDDAMSVSVYHNIHDNANKKPKTIVGKPKCSLDLEQGCKIPEAAGMNWMDDFFDNDMDDLIAVFDHDYKTVFRSDMKLKILDTIVPIFSTILGFAIIIFLIGSAFQGNGDPEFITFGRGVSRFGALVVFFDLLYLGLSLHGSYRLIKSKVYSFHLAVKRDGICFVQDCHMKCCSIVAALHIFDCCIFKSKKSQTIPFDQITGLTVIGPAVDAPRCCCCCCRCSCLMFPFYRVGIDTSSSNPRYFAQAMRGLCLPHEFEKLVWGMKRDKGEEIHRRAEQNTTAMCSALMFDNIMKYGMSPVQFPIPGLIGGSSNTAPTMSVSMASTSSNMSYSHNCHRSSNGIDL